MQTRKITLAALLIAIGTLTAHVVYIPAGVSRCFPVQHAINVMAAVLLGADHATAVGFVIACLRNMFGTGSILAFPGSIVGACLAGILYQRHKTLSMAVVGEIFGTGVLGGFLAWVIAYFILGSKSVAWFFIPPFLISSIGGSLIALALLKSGVFQNIIALNKK